VCFIQFPKLPQAGAFDEVAKCNLIIGTFFFFFFIIIL
jgi:hypothetical protein